jgi:hypothetical protein
MDSTIARSVDISNIFSVRLLCLYFRCVFVGDRCGRDHMVIGLTTTCAIIAYQCEFEPCSWRGVLDTTLCDKVCQ